MFICICQNIFWGNLSIFQCWWMWWWHWWYLLATEKDILPQSLNLSRHSSTSWQDPPWKANPCGQSQLEKYFWVFVVHKRIVKSGYWISWIVWQSIGGSSIFGVDINYGRGKTIDWPSTVSQGGDFWRTNPLQIILISWILKLDRFSL